jgi:dienelactone hydrolase
MAMKNTCGPKESSTLDLTGRRTAWVLWYVPILLVIVGLSWNRGRVWLWVPAFVVMGMGCLVNAKRCRRTHCYITGPLFFLAALFVALSALGVVALHPGLFLLVVFGACCLAQCAEIRLGKYRIGITAALAALVLAAGAIADARSAPEIMVTEMRIPTRGSGSKGLEAVMVRPSDTVPHPLALLTHGTPREPQERVEMTPLRYIPQAREFARRGWTTVIVMRRGFGDSGGGYEEEGHACSRFPNFVGATKEAVKDLREAAAYLRTRPEVDPTRIIAVGVSTGGLAMVGLTADPPPGLMVAVNFAGGRGSNAPDHVCNPEALVDAFAEFGKRSKVPMLWIYAVNDHYFGPQLAQAFYRAFVSKGGEARFIAAGPFGDDGHKLFSLRGIPIWAPMVDDFLKRHDLQLRDSLLEVPVPTVEPPAYLDKDGRDEFQTYLLSAPHKAFAAAPSRAFGVSVGQRTAQVAEKNALKACSKIATRNDPCALIMIDDAKPRD